MKYDYSNSGPVFHKTPVRTQSSSHWLPATTALHSLRSSAQAYQSEIKT